MQASYPSRTSYALNGMVAAPHHLPVDAGVFMLRIGGTAIDAAIATNAVLTVLYPHQTTVGGDLFLLYHEASTGKLYALNGSGRAPVGADREALRAAGHETMPSRGIHTVTVPGTVDAWSQAMRKFGRLGLEDVLQPAIMYASQGFPVSPGLARGLQIAEPLLRQNEEAYETYIPGGTVPKVGDVLRLPALADSLREIAREGRDAFYTGRIAEAIASTSRRLGGPMTMVDLAGHQGEWVEPVTTDYKGLTVAEFPPNSQGITALIELNLAEQATLGENFGTPEHLHALIEAKKIAFAVRNKYLTDPNFAEIDVPKLVSKEYARELWRSFDPQHAGPGQIDNDADTVAIVVVDRDGNAAAMIQSQYQGFGSGIMADGTGIMLQNRGAYFSLDDDHANRLEGGKRPLHTLMPAMLYRDGELAGPFVSQGGDAQAQVHLQVITDLMDFGMYNDPQGALDLPRWVAGGEKDRQTNVVQLEGRFPESTIEGLRARGHEVQVVEPWAQGMGHAQLILRDPKTGVLRGGSDVRADGYAIGF